MTSPPSATNTSDLKPHPPNIPDPVGPADPATLDWKNLGFKFLPTRCYVRRVWRDGQWGNPELLTGEYLSIHIAQTGLHYGQSCFEGLKAFRCRDGQIRIFRPDLNADRLSRSSCRVGMPPLPSETFLADIRLAVNENVNYVPPFGTGGSLYIRPIIFGSGAELSLAPALEFTFLTIVVPVSDYYRDGVTAVPALIVDDFDRAAPLGVGSAKLAGNYAPCIPSGIEAKKRGYPITLFLDAKTHTQIEEFATSNFIALIHHKGATPEYTLVTPKSESILPSVTRRSLCDLAEKQLGWAVEQRPVTYAELRAGTFTEVAACGTAVVITPISKLVRDLPGEPEAEVTTVSSSNTLGDGFRQLYDLMRAIQSGDAPDPEGWLWPVSDP